MLFHLTSKQLIALVIVAALLALSGRAVAANPKVLGTIISSSRATISGVAIPGGGTLTADDLLSTAKGGSALVRFSPATQADLSGDTSVRFAAAGGRVSALLSSGTMVARSSGKDALVVETARFMVEPAERNTVYVVALLPNDTMIVSARQGDISVTETNSGKKHFVSAGHYAKISDAPAGTPAQGAAGGVSAGLLNNTPLVFAISVGTGVGTGVGIAEGPLGVAANPSPTAP